jgi:uncharacterized damage-inducible protein DinB
VGDLADSATEALNMFVRLAETCPADVWEEKAGRWSVWQHVAHVASSASLFVPGPALPMPEGLTAEICQLKVVAGPPIGQRILLGYLKAAVAKATAFLGTLDDQDLPRPNEACRAIGLDWTVTKTLSVLYAHALYHLGHADAVLRARDHKGIF